MTQSPEVTPATPGGFFADLPVLATAADSFDTSRYRAAPDDWVLVLKAQSHRTQDMNRLDAFSRLHEIVNSVAVAPVQRRPTRPTRASVQIGRAHV